MAATAMNAARASAGAFATLFLCGCVSTRHLVAPREAGPLELAAGQHVQECFLLDAGDRVLFRFEASPGVLFSIRYTSGIANVQTMVRPLTESESGFFTAAENLTYCFDWAASNNAVTRLTYHLSLARPR
jgi:hypothetical protein